MQVERTSTGGVAEGLGTESKGELEPTSAQAGISNFRESAAKLAKKTRETMGEVAERAQEYGETALEETSSVIRRYPAQSLFIGFGLGILIGVAISRR